MNKWTREFAFFAVVMGITAGAAWWTVFETGDRGIAAMAVLLTVMTLAAIGLAFHAARR